MVIWVLVHPLEVIQRHLIIGEQPHKEKGAEGESQEHQKQNTEIADTSAHTI